MTSRLTHQGLGNELLVYTSLEPRPHSLQSGKFSSGEVIVKEAISNTIKSLQASGLSFSTHNVYLTTTQTLSQSHKVSIV